MKPLKLAAEKSPVFLTFGKTNEKQWRDVFTFRRLTEADQVPLESRNKKTDHDPDGHE